MNNPRFPHLRDDYFTHGGRTTMVARPMRFETMTREPSARVTSRPAPPPLSDMTVHELRALAKARGLSPKLARANRQTLLKALR